MLSATRVAALATASTRMLRRDPGPLVGRVAQPLLSVAVLHPLYVGALGDHQAGTRQVVTGFLVLFSLLAMSVVGNAVLTDRQWRTFDRLRASPLSVAELLAGKALPVFGFLAVQQTVLLGWGVAALGLQVADLGLLALADAVWATTVLCGGFAVAVLVRSLAQLSAVVDIGATLLTALGGGMVPLALMPAWAAAVAPYSPAAWAMTALGGAMRGDAGAVLHGCALLGGLSVLAAAVAAGRLSRGWRRDTLL